jgi:hypothetical protein
MTTKQDAIRRLFKAMNSSVGNLRFGAAKVCPIRRAARDQHPQHQIPALARLAEAGNRLPMPTNCPTKRGHSYSR